MLKPNLIKRLSLEVHTYLPSLRTPPPPLCLGFSVCDPGKQKAALYYGKTRLHSNQNNINLPPFPAPQLHLTHRVIINLGRRGSEEISAKFRQ